MYLKMRYDESFSIQKSFKAVLLQMIRIFGDGFCWPFLSGRSWPLQVWGSQHARPFQGDFFFCPPPSPRTVLLYYGLQNLTASRG